MSLEAISEALTHSDTITTKTYVNTSNVVPLPLDKLLMKTSLVSRAKIGHILGQIVCKSHRKKHP